MTDKTETAILNAAFATYAAKPTATLAEVATAAGIGRATLHRHFKGREDLMTALALKAIKDIDTAFDEATRDAESYTDAMRLGLDAMTALADRQTFLETEPLDHVPEVTREYERQRKELTEAMEEVRKEGSIAANIPTAWAVKTYEAMIYTAWSMVKDGEATPKQASALAWQTLESGLAGDA